MLILRLKFRLYCGLNKKLMKKNIHFWLILNVIIKGRKFTH